MNIFEKKSNKGDGAQLPLSPVELYQTCPYKEGYGYLRGIQEEVLNLWNTNRNQRDVVCKMSTGSGKTLTGLLMLYSKMIETKQPSLFTCPDHQLVSQTVQLAAQYGIPVCVFEGKVFPPDFLNAKKILICPFQKLFNGKSIFNRDKIKIGSILLDDAHKCVDIARDKSSIKIDRNHVIAKRLFSLFTDSLKEQLSGMFVRLEYSDPIMMTRVPYWTWLDNKHEILSIIAEYVSKIDKDFDNQEEIKFNWLFLSSNIESYDCYIGPNHIEIVPVHVPYQEIPSFHEADHRFILSATFEDNYDLIKDLGIDYNSVLNPIVPAGRKDVGKRLIIAPNRFSPALPEEDIRKFIAEYSQKEYNIVVLVPSGPKAEEWQKFGATKVDKENIEEAINTLKTKKGNFMVFVNRYDGIDLYHDLCRILVIDGLPQFGSLLEEYGEVRLDSLRASKKAQIIEQGLGRASRSGGDYSVTFLMGQNLLSFLAYEKNLEYFTNVTRMHLELGLSLLDGEDSESPLEIIKQTCDYCLTQHISWLDFHNKALLGVNVDVVNIKQKQRLDFAESERKAIDFLRRREYVKGAEILLNDILSNETLTPKEKAWFNQLAAQFMFLGDKNRSNDLQTRANTLTTHMFFPQFSGFSYRKMNSILHQAAEVRNNLSKFNLPKDIEIHCNGLINNLSYNPEIKANKFEHALAGLGKFLGFNVQMPERDAGNGPDVLWCLANDHYLILEAKSEAIHKEISRENINQLLGSEQWFKNNYPSAKYTAVTLQKPCVKGKDVNINPDFRVIDEESLELLHQNLKHFINSLKSKLPKDYTHEEIEHLLKLNNLSSEIFIQKYLRPIKIYSN